MQQSLYKKLSSLWNIKKEFRLKVILLSTTFLLMSACLVIWKPLKSSLFSKLVGATMAPTAKLLSPFLMIPLIILYSLLSDRLKRHHLIYYFTLTHGIIGLMFFYFLSHPVYGLTNTAAEPNRFVGWAFYFFMESFDAFFSTSFWSFADSINNPSDAKNHYSFFVCGSKIGGIITAGILFFILSSSTEQAQLIILPRALLFGCGMLFSAAATIYYLIKKVPENVMHGYEQSYQLEQKKSAVKVKKTFLETITNMFSGLIIMVKSSYVFGIFSLIVFYEIIIAIFDYLVMLQADASYPTLGGMTAFYASYYLIMNFIGLFIALLGTAPILKFLGLRASLFIYPLICASMLIFALIFPHGNILVVLLIGLRAFNYALNHPIREVLYIPTTKDIKFKAKTWTDAFGSRMAKTFGNYLNSTMTGLPQATALFASTGLSIGLTGIWLVVVYFLGKRLQNAIDNKEVIGNEGKK